jgi:hypothetical protein
VRLFCLSSHYINQDGSFKTVCAELLHKGFVVPYVDQWEEGEARITRKKKAASKTKYTCPTCDLNAWAKPNVLLICGTFDTPLEAEER